MYCKYCGQELPPPKPGGHRMQMYCNDAHKQAYYRRLRKEQPGEAQITRHELAAAQARIAELEHQIAHLEYVLDLEKRFYQDTQARGFKSWLRNQAPSSFRQKLLADTLLPARGSRAYYEAHLRNMKYSAGEIEEFRHLWKLLLLHS